MEFTVNKKTLKAIVMETAKTKTSKLPTLSVWKISEVDGKANFFRFIIREQISAEVDIIGPYVSDGVVLLAEHDKIVKALKIGKAAAVTIDTVKKTLDGIDIASDVDESKIPYMPIDDAERAFVFSATQEEFALVDKKAVPHVSDDETRYFMNGVMFDSVPFLDVANTVNIAATNGRTLFLRDAFVPSAGIGSAIVPPYAFVRPKKTERVIAELTERKQASKKYFTLESIGDGFRVKKITECIDGQFPNYRRVTPGNLDPNFSANTEEFRTAIQSARVLCNKSMRVILTIGKTSGTVMAVGEGATEKEFPFSCEFDRDDYKIAVNADYLVYSLPDTEKTLVRFDESNMRALTIQNSGIAVIMPMQLE